ncbi:MAG: hypothetical protein VX970_11405 [Planctomycetota bacterium]|nr:hypothetical protein [Planctomycetota bacterium]MEC8338246.1 hypothetical protein [Planctomycetota bacterium]
MPLEVGTGNYHCHADSQVPLDVAMEESLSRIVGIKLNDQFVFCRHGDRVFEWRVLQIELTWETEDAKEGGVRHSTSVLSNRHTRSAMKCGVPYVKSMPLQRAIETAGSRGGILDRK